MSIGSSVAEDAGNVDANQQAKDEAALAELSQKVVQLTKVIVFLHTRSDGYEDRCKTLKTANCLELKQVSEAAAARVEEQRKATAAAAEKLNDQIIKLERRYAERVQQVQKAADELRAAVQRRKEAAPVAAANFNVGREACVVEVQRRAEHLRCQLSTAATRAKCDDQWLMRQMAAEATRERMEMDRRFEQTCAQLRSENTKLTEKLRAEKEAATQALRAEHAQCRSEAAAASERDYEDAVHRQELSFQAEREALEAKREHASALLAADRQAAASAKEECEEKQRLLDEMSRELQERKRQGQALTQQADRSHSRKMRAEAEARELRRRKAAMERSLGSSGNAASSGHQGAVSEAERAVVTVSEDLRAAQSRLEALKNELGQKRRLLEERRAAVAEREQRSQQLAKDLAAERRRSDELQKVLLRLEQGF
eukprot:TRINITY_DN63435_c0_g1_i1.p1 TRINITY_DN63435_c0_g1~~TRINITY_DN63435_c0_g1_i1.p1  ORF type:complete len:428 (+),score=126.92 TRINITY_DN63435_c0_g1_i1:89-1372(+)